MKPGQPKDIDEYIATCPAEVRPILARIRATVRKAAPDATEKISYGIPTFFLGGNLVHFAAFKGHVGFYPPVEGDEQLMQDVAAYAGPKGNLRFPLSEPMPYSLIRRIVQARVRASRVAVGQSRPGRVARAS